MDLNPSIANMLEKNTMYGSLVTAKIAGIESTAKTKSVNSTIKRTKKRGVISFLPLIFTKNRLP